MNTANQNPPSFESGFWWLPLLDSNQRLGGRNMLLNEIGLCYERLRCPTKSSGLRLSSILSTAAHKAMPLPLPPAAGHCFGYLLRCAQYVNRRNCRSAELWRNRTKEANKKHHPFGWCFLLAPLVGLEPTTCGLTVRRSTD